jgi:hypothetical protein
MADDDGGSARVLQHFCGKIAGMRARGVWMAVLRAYGEAFAIGPLRKTGDQRGRRADQQIGLAGKGARACQHRVKLGHGGLEPVHLPVAGDQGPDAIIHVKFLTVCRASLAERREFDHIGPQAIPCPLTASIRARKRGCGTVTATL